MYAESQDSHFQFRIPVPSHSQEWKPMIPDYCDFLNFLLVPENCAHKALQSLHIVGIWIWTPNIHIFMYSNMFASCVECEDGLQADHLAANCKWSPPPRPQVRRLSGCKLDAKHPPGYFWLRKFNVVWPCYGCYFIKNYKVLLILKINLEKTMRK